MESRSLRSRRPPKVSAPPTTQAGGHLESNSQPLDDDSDVYIQSLYDDSDEDIQQFNDESDESFLPAGKPTRKPARKPIRKRATRKDKGSTATNDQPQQEDGDDYEAVSRATTSRPNKCVARKNNNPGKTKRRMFHNRRIGQTKASNDSTKDKQSGDVVAEELSLLSTPETRNINALLHALNEPPGLKVKTEVRPTELTITHNGVTPLGELPNAPDRDYKALIKLKDVTVTFDPQGDQSRTLLPYNKTKATSIMAFIDAWIKVIPTWEVRLWNDARQPSEEEREYLYMFPEIVHPYP